MVENERGLRKAVRDAVVNSLGFCHRGAFPDRKDRLSARVFPIPIMDREGRTGRVAGVGAPQEAARVSSILESGLEEAVGVAVWRTEIWYGRVKSKSAGTDGVRDSCALISHLV